MRSLFLRIFLYFWLAMVLIGTAFTLIHLGTPDWAHRRKVGMITRALKSHGLETVARMEAEGPQAMGRMAEELGRELNVQVYLFRGGTSVKGSPRPGRGMLALANRAAREGRPLRDASRTRDRYAVPLDARQGVDGWVVVGELSHPHRLRRYLQPETLHLRLLVLFLVSGLICYVLARYLSRPLRGLRRATQRLAAGDLSARVEPSLLRRADETGELGRDFDLMAARLQALLDAQGRILRDISHELRSPLARLSVALGLARKKIATEDGTATGAEAVLDRIQKEADRLNDLVGQLTTLNLLESGAEPVDSDSMALDELLGDIVQDSLFEGQPRQVEVVLTRSSPLVIRGSSELLRRALENVVRNAIHATSPGTQVEVSLTREVRGAAHGADIQDGEDQMSAAQSDAEATEETSGGSAQSDAEAAEATEEATGGPAPGDAVLITVRDHGPGVPEEALGDIFRPFYRVTEARERRTGGSGLGLSITQRAVTLHGGTVTARNAPGGGLLVLVRLPLTRGATLHYTAE